jgi:hypothetical protein
LLVSTIVSPYRQTASYCLAITTAMMPILMLRESRSGIDNLEKKRSPFGGKKENIYLWNLIYKRIKQEAYGSLFRPEKRFHIQAYIR